LALDVVQEITEVALPLPELLRGEGVLKQLAVLLWCVSFLVWAKGVFVGEVVCSGEICGGSDVKKPGTRGVAGLAIF
jgi:hypothetical protein